MGVTYTIKNIEKCFPNIKSWIRHWSFLHSLIQFINYQHISKLQDSRLTINSNLRQTQKTRLVLRLGCFIAQSKNCTPV